jgi:uncharacterized protein YbdZ (MbtH family)
VELLVAALMVGLMGCGGAMTPEMEPELASIEQNLWPCDAYGPCPSGWVCVQGSTCRQACEPFIKLKTSQSMTAAALCAGGQRCCTPGSSAPTYSCAPTCDP